MQNIVHVCSYVDYSIVFYNNVKVISFTKFEKMPTHSVHVYTLWTCKKFCNELRNIDIWLLNKCAKIFAEIFIDFFIWIIVGILNASNMKKILRTIKDCDNIEL